MQQRLVAWLFIPVCSFFHFVVVPSAPQPTTFAQQTALVLLHFKQAITKDPSGALNSWVQPSMHEPNASLTPQFCSWFGITCDPQNSDSVVSIVLPGCELEGSLTPIIGNITSLILIDLSMNSLSGSVPHSLSMLSSLKTLKLFSNHFMGTIPASLYNCSSLVLLDISNNTMTGAIPPELGALSSLKALILSRNFLSGGLPMSVFNVSVLQFLDLSNNYMTGEVPNDIGTLKSLLSLNLASNNLTGPIPPSLSDIVSLQGVDISNNLLNDKVPSELAACLFLTVVILSNNLLVGSIPTRFGEMQNLRVLHLENNLLSGTIPSGLGNCKRLEDLVLSHNMFDGTIPVTVASLPNLLLSFDLSYNLLEGSLPPELGEMSFVLKINMAHNKLSGGINWLGNCSGLEFLDLSNNNFTGSIPQFLGSLQSLKWVLNLSHNSLEGPIPDLRHLRYLRVLDFSHNELTGTVPASLVNLHGLMVFNVSFNRLSGCFPQADTIVSTHINVLWVQGNPSLCVPSLSDSCSHVCGTHLAWYAQIPWYIWFLLAMAFAIWMGIGIFFYLLNHEWSTPFTTTNDQAAWVLNYMKFTAEDLQEAIIETSLIGSGASSDVYRIILNDGRLFALKCFKPTARQQLFNTEIDVLTSLKHRNLVQIKGCCRPGRAILLEYMENGSLKKQLYDMPRCTLDLETRIGIARDTAEGLVYLHSYCHVPVIHCDLKPGNILLDKEFRAYLADFGLAKYTAGGLSNARHRRNSRVSSTLLRLPGTLGYIAPEYGSFKTTPSEAGDVYSYGVVLLEILTRRKPGQGNLPPGIYSLPALVRSAALNHNIESVIDPELRTHLRKRLDHEKVSLLVSIGLACTDEDHLARPTMEQVVSSLKFHPKFRAQDFESPIHRNRLMLLNTLRTILVDNGFVGDTLEDAVTELQHSTLTCIENAIHSFLARPILGKRPLWIQAEAELSSTQKPETHVRIKDSGDKGKQILRIQ